MEGAFDATVAVIADDATREQRLAERGQPGLRGREQRQLDQDEKGRRADHVIRNDGSLEDLSDEVRRVIAEVAGEGK
jgi:dephospho-CoA kinase